MINVNATGKILSFPAPALGTADESWTLRILETRDNLLSALEFLRTSYNQMLAGMPVKEADEILATVVDIMTNEKVNAYRVVGNIRMDRSAPPDGKRRTPLLFPAV